MTQSEFLETINDWDSLKSFCWEEGCDYLDDVMDEDDIDDYMNSCISDIVRNYNNWWELRDMLYDVPSGDGYYLCRGYGDFEELGDYDFNSYKDDVCDWALNNGSFDEEEEENCEEETDPEDLIPIEDEDISVTELMSVCGTDLELKERELAEDNKQDMREDINMLFED